MKGKWLLSALLGVVLIGGSACGEPPHEHLYVERTVDATCVAEGYNEFVCECGDSYRGELTTPKTAHTGMVICDYCQIDYFEEVKNLILANGQTGGTMTFYTGETQYSTDANLYSRVIYDSEDDEIVLWSNYDATSGYDIDLMITIPNSSNGTSMSEGKYIWQFEMGDGNALGVITASSFSSYTTKLSMTVQNGLSGASLQNTICELSATMTKLLLTEAFIPLLENGTNGVTVKNFGFVNY